jgi:hypothetical protein
VVLAFEVFELAFLFGEEGTGEVGGGVATGLGLEGQTVDAGLPDFALFEVEVEFIGLEGR